MKIIIASIIAFILYTHSFAASKWYTNLQEASEIAKKDGKAILVDFTGSDWCKWCITLHDEVLDKSEFEEYAEKNLVLVKFDFPNRKKQSKETKSYNAKMQQAFQVQGFPSLFLLTPDGDIIGKMGYMPGGPETYFQFFNMLYSSRVDFSIRENVRKLVK